MSIVNADLIIERAQKGEKVSTAERRMAVAYVMSTMPTVTNGEIASWFGLTERAIRMDKQHVRKTKADQIKEDDVALVLADICFTYDNQIRDIEKCKKACKVGTPLYLQCCKSIFDMQARKVEALQNLGYYPKNLGNMTVERFEYKSIVHRDGSVDTRPVDMFDAKELDTPNTSILDAEFEEPKALIEGPKEN